MAAPAAIIGAAGEVMPQRSGGGHRATPRVRRVQTGGAGAL
jgi:hypothetical protein